MHSIVTHIATLTLLVMQKLLGTYNCSQPIFDCWPYIIHIFCVPEKVHRQDAVHNHVWTRQVRQ